MNLWPPFLFAGIRVVELSDDYRYVKVRLRMHRWNRNYVGTHFGGSLFAMTDPFWMLLVLHHLGRDHLVWDQAGEIEFVKPGRGTVHAEFRLTDEHLAELRSLAADGGKALVWFNTDVVDESGEVVARTRKQVYTRRKKRDRGILPVPLEPCGEQTADLRSAR
jgi:acyl-coenzyme A thioesterase PaaI-like protein